MDLTRNVHWVQILIALHTDVGELRYFELLFGFDQIPSFNII